jgi:sugar diacid utilization regulator
MTRAAKVTYFAALFMGLAIGAFLGFQYHSGALEASFSLRQMTTEVALANFSYLQYKHADHEHAEAALHTFANFLEEMEKLKPEKAQKYDLAITYTRLALLEDAANSAEQPRTCMEKARFWYTAAAGRDLSDSKMKAWVKTWDAIREPLLQH